jgi:hypothetical protein
MSLLISKIFARTSSDSDGVVWPSIRACPLLLTYSGGLPSRAGW